MRQKIKSRKLSTPKNKRINRQSIRKENSKINKKDTFDSDVFFAFITGYTKGGVPYGITWE